MQQLHSAKTWNSPIQITPGGDWPSRFFLTGEANHSLKLVIRTLEDQQDHSLSEFLLIEARQQQLGLRKTDKRLGPTFTL